jgi:malate/lactate dehydrogenase
MHRLNKDAVVALEGAIRKEKQERLQLWERRVKIFASAATAITGFMGTLIGVMTLITLHRS